LNAFAVEGLTVGFGAQVLENLTANISSAEITAVMGPNGSGKTTLLWALAGELESNAKVSGVISPSLAALKPKLRLERVAVVPQRASDLLFLDTLADELAESDRQAKQTSGATAKRFASRNRSS
jgi:energy-coupling factor transport system ATP-binding protein